MRSVFLVIIGLFLFFFTFLFAEPFVTKEKVDEEFQVLTGEQPTKHELIGKNNSNGLIVLQQTQNNKMYRISYNRWDFKKELKGEKQSLIVSIEEKIEKKQEEQFKHIYKK